MFTNVIRPGSLWRSAERLIFLLVQETTVLPCSPTILTIQSFTDLLSDISIGYSPDIQLKAILRMVWSLYRRLIVLRFEVEKLWGFSWSP